MKPCIKILFTVAATSREGVVIPLYFMAMQ